MIYFFSPDCSGNPFWITQQRKQMGNAKRLQRKAGTWTATIRKPFARQNIKKVSGKGEEISLGYLFSN